MGDKVKCPECHKEMRWVNDELYEEDCILETAYDCKDCFIDVIKRIKLKGGVTLNEYY